MRQQKKYPSQFGFLEPKASGQPEICFPIASSVREPVRSEHTGSLTPLKTEQYFILTKSLFSSYIFGFFSYISLSSLESYSSIDFLSDFSLQFPITGLKSFSPVT